MYLILRPPHVFCNSICFYFCCCKNKKRHYFLINLLQAQAFIIISCQNPMDRFCWVTANEHFLGENVIAQQSDVRLYNGEDRVG